MAFRVVFSDEAEGDFDLVFEFLVDSYRQFGESETAAFERAAARLVIIREDADSIAVAPFRGTLHKDVLPGLRHVTIRGAVFWFDVVEQSSEARVVGVFFGGQDHRRRMLARLLG